MTKGQAIRAGRQSVMLGLIGVLCGTALAGTALAQGAYPDRPIKLIVPDAPGGVYDAVGRPWAEKMGTTLGTVVIENRGGGGSVGAAAAAEPDGYTLFLGGSGPNIVNPLTGKTTYDPVKDFAPIAVVVMASGLEPVRDSDPESAGTLLRDELARWAPVVQSVGLKK